MRCESTVLCILDTILWKEGTENPADSVGVITQAVSSGPYFLKSFIILLISTQQNTHEYSFYTRHGYALL